MHFKGKIKLKRQVQQRKKMKRKIYQEHMRKHKRAQRRLQWLKAIGDEFASLEKQRTWTLVRRDEIGQHAILTNKWVFVKKDDIDGERFKARLVI